MLVAVILGNRLNDDGSITELMRCRLCLALEIYKRLSPDKIVLSGGVANEKAGKSEAQVMCEFLLENGVPADKIVQENQSLTTEQNAKFSLPIVAQLGAKELLLCTSQEHMHRRFLNPIKLFRRQLKKYPNIALKTCCCLEEIKNLIVKN